MKTRILIIGMIATIVGLSSCEHGSNVTIEQEKGIVNAVYQSLDLTPEQFGTNMVKQGLHEILQYEFLANKYKTFANKDQRSANTIIINISFRNDTILQVEYERSLNKESNIAAHYKLFSDILADNGYTMWHGYYEDPDDEQHVSGLVHGGNDYSHAQTAEDREDLCAHINNEHLGDNNTTQYFAEYFIHTHKDKSQWEGQTLLWSSSYFSGLNEGSGQYYKDVSFKFWLERIQ